MYKVKVAFTDLQDKGYHYATGDAYPREGLEVSEERIAELSGAKNKRKLPLIKKEESQETEPEKPKPKPKSKPRAKKEQ